MIRTFFRSIKRSIIWLMWRAYNLPTLWRFHKARFHYGPELIVEEFDGLLPREFRNAAVIAASYNEILEHSTLRQIKALAEQGFDVYLIWNGEMAESTRELVSRHCVSITIRKRFGYDWAGYKIIMERINADPKYHDAGVFLSNDSFFFFEETERLILDILALDTDVRGLALNKEITPHIVGAFLYLAASARMNDHVRQFWADLQPTWDKRKIIFSGELNHFRVIRKAGLSIQTIIPELVSRDPETFRELAIANLLRDPTTKFSDSNDALSARAFNGFALRAWGLKAETKSILHEFGPFLSSGWGIPLKLDLVKWPHLHWSTLEILSILETSAFVSDADLSFLRSYFAHKDSWVSHSGLDKFFFYNGYTG